AELAALQRGPRGGKEIEGIEVSVPREFRCIALTGFWGIDWLGGIKTTGSQDRRRCQAGVFWFRGLPRRVRSANFNLSVRGRGQVRSADFVFAGIDDWLGGIRSTGGADCWRCQADVFWLRGL